MNDIVSPAMVSGILRRATNVLFITDRVATAMGVLFGIVLDGVARFLKPVLTTLPVALSEITIFHYVALGIFTSNLIAILRRPLFPPSIAQALKAIEQMERSGKITKAQAKLMYLSIINKLVNSVTLNKKTKEQVSIYNEVLQRDSVVHK